MGYAAKLAAAHLGPAAPGATPSWTITRTDGTAAQVRLFPLTAWILDSRAQGVHSCREIDLRTEQGFNDFAQFITALESERSAP